MTRNPRRQKRLFPLLFLSSLSLAGSIGVSGCPPSSVQRRSSLAARIQTPPESRPVPPPPRRRSSSTLQGQTLPPPPRRQARGPLRRFAVSSPSSRRLAASSPPTTQPEQPSSSPPQARHSSLRRGSPQAARPPLSAVLHGFRLLQQKQTAKALTAFRQLYRRYPRSIDVNWGLANAAFTSSPGRFPLAIRHYTLLLSLLQDRPNKGRYRLIRRTTLEGLGISYRARQKNQKSLFYLGRLVKTFPRYGPGYYHLACTHRQNGSPRRRVQRLLQHAFRRDPSLRKIHRRDPCFR